MIGSTTSFPGHPYLHYLITCSMQITVPTPTFWLPTAQVRSIYIQ